MAKDIPPILPVIPEVVKKTDPLIEKINSDIAYVEEVISNVREGRGAEKAAARIESIRKTEEQKRRAEFIEKMRGKHGL